MASNRIKRLSTYWIFKWHIHLSGVSHLWDVSQTCSAMCTHRNELFALLFISVLPGLRTDARWKGHLIWIQHLREHKKKKMNNSLIIKKTIKIASQVQEESESKKKKERKIPVAIILIFFKKIIRFCETLFTLLLIFTILTLVFLC